VDVVEYYNLSEVESLDSCEASKDG